MSSIIVSDKNSPKRGLFEFQKWTVYKKSLELVKKLFLLSIQIRKSGYPDLANQLDRASSSILLNLAEGSAGRSLKDKKNFWRVSKGSLFECVAIFDLANTIIKINNEQIKNTHQEMNEIGKMLSGLIRWADNQKQI